MGTAYCYQCHSVWICALDQWDNGEPVYCPICNKVSAKFYKHEEQAKDKVT